MGAVGEEEVARGEGADVRGDEEGGLNNTHTHTRGGKKNDEEQYVLVSVRLDY